MGGAGSVRMGTGRAIRVTCSGSAAGRMRARGRAVRGGGEGWGGGHLRLTVWRATRPVSAAARDVAPDGPMPLELYITHMFYL